MKIQPITAATNQARTAKSKAGNFRWEFYHRMAVTELQVPELQMPEVASRIPEEIGDMFEYSRFLE
jgi:transcriptional regulator of acetoin/glycerol metabolism